MLFDVSLICRQNVEKHGRSPEIVEDIRKGVVVVGGYGILLSGCGG